MKTVSVLLQTLCVPCACRCRYCLLSCSGSVTGAPWDQSTDYALRFKEWLLQNRPDLGFQFAFGCSMEHLDLREALRFLRSIGSPQAEYLQCDGMRLRDRAECDALVRMLSEEGVKHLNFTFYGLPEYHDRFAGRRDDFAFILRLAQAAGQAGLTVSAGIPLTRESVPQADRLIGILTGQVSPQRIFLFVPHEEGRGVLLDGIRLAADDLCGLSESARSLLNRDLYRTEEEWVTGGAFIAETKRTILISLRKDTMQRYRGMDPGQVLAEAEALDDAYYASFPTFPELAERYGDPGGKRFYRQRDLFYHYRRLYAEENRLSVYDVTDERQTGSRRY